MLLIQENGTVCYQLPSRAVFAPSAMKDVILCDKSWGAENKL